MLYTRGGQGTAGKLKFERLNAFSCYIKFEGTDQWIDSRNLHDPYYSNLNDFRHQSYLIEMADKKRSSQTTDEIPSKKRLTVSDVMSEQQMFQEELLKLVERVNKMEKTLKRTVAILKSVQERFDAHISADLSGAITVASTIASLGDGPDNGGCLDSIDWDCNCPDNLGCPVHPDFVPKKQ